MNQASWKGGTSRERAKAFAKRELQLQALGWGVFGGGILATKEGRAGVAKGFNVARRFITRGK
jgi:hypothetical protein